MLTISTEKKKEKKSKGQYVLTTLPNWVLAIELDHLF